jgi:hypothetical protein
MKKGVLIGLLAVGFVIVALVAAPAQQGITSFGLVQVEAPDWSFSVEPADSGWIMTCTEGCAWERLSFDCGDSLTNCRAQVTSFGVTVESAEN